MVIANPEETLSMKHINRPNLNRLSSPESPVVLAILDGWGHREEELYNAVKVAKTPNSVPLIKDLENSKVTPSSPAKYSP